MPRTRLLALLGAAVSLVTAAPAAAAPSGGQTFLLDRPTGAAPLPWDGAGRASLSTQPLSADGRWLVFSSSSDSLLQGDDDSGVHVYRLDRQTGALAQVDVGADGSQLGLGLQADGAEVSADGDRVGFMLTTPAGAVTGLAPGFYVKQLSSGTLELATRADGAGGAPAVVGAPALSGNGRHVAFTTTAPLQTAAGAGRAQDVYVRDLDDGRTTRLDVDSDNRAVGSVKTNARPAIDFDGDVVAWIGDYARDPNEHDGLDEVYVEGSRRAQGIPIPGRATSGRAYAVALAGNDRWLAWIGPSDQVFARALGVRGDQIRVDVPGPDGRDGIDYGLSFEPVAAADAASPRLDFVSSGTLDHDRDLNGLDDLYSVKPAEFGQPGHVQMLTTGTGDGHVAPGAAAVDGSVVVFAEAAEDLPGGDALARQVYERLPAGSAPPQGRDVLRSRPSSPPPLPDEAGDAALRTHHAVSDDGSRVVFSSRAAAFGAVAEPQLVVLGYRSSQVLLRDAVSGETTLVSRSLGGRPALGTSRLATIDGAGRRVAFLSSAHDLVPDSPTRGGISHAYVRDLDSGVTTLADRTTLGVPLPGGVVDAVLSGDGRHLAYRAVGPGPPEAPADIYTHVYLVDLDSGRTTLVDRAPGSGLPGSGDATDVELSRDGSRVAFVSDARNLGAPGTEDPQVYVRDVAAGTTTWVSVPQDGDPRHALASMPSLSGDGTRIAFYQLDVAFGWGMPADRGGQVFVRDLAAATTTLASVTDGAGPPAFDGIAPSLDADGSQLAFLAAAGDSPRFLGYQAYLRDLATGATTLMSVAAGGGPSRAGVRYASASGDGRCVAFDSASGDLGGGYGPDYVHAYLRCTGSAGDIPGGGGGGDGAVPPVAAARDRTAPRITRARLSHRSFAVVRPAKGHRRAAASRARRRAVPAGTKIAFRLSEAARVTGAVERTLPGERRGRRCVAARRAGRPARSSRGAVSAAGAARRGGSRRGAAKRKRCTRVVTVATPLTASLRAGARSLAFSGRYGRGGRRALAPGAYRLRLVARDRAGNSSRPVRLAFTVVRAAR
ncbi:hypothetical protein Q5424_23040 [Conexibacter sp. JD483]|uniref:hypothetical protein n=1 Tax=unclassified Conexibacter TaxID=2627773 RepID=UPI00271CB7DC|nr:MULTISPECIES: hypothetical protein [unclassified Conexibacter]MDO8186541.1 hypothetical protein [Conexibacter sp. CPCC 205706]MDO8200110.1 hypothetical protein [Conexibacter sp. CPCC 205762]MDR9371992.1 hypothetical protein [Conexibacter sp. JD483]